MAAKKKQREEVKPKKDKDSVIPSRDARAAGLKEYVNNKMRGNATIMSASDYALPFLTKRLPTGILSLDIALGGGFPAGGLSQIAGRRNAGKNLLAWQMIRQLQHMLGHKMKVLFAVNEMQVDRDQGKKLGVRISMGRDFVNAQNLSRQYSGRPPLTKEAVDYLLDEVGTIDEVHAWSAENFYDIILNAVENNVYHLIVIDSIGNVQSEQAVNNESVSDKTYGGASGPNTQFLQKLTSMLTMRDQWDQVRDTCLIGINQIRDNIGNTNKPLKTPGGNALEHAKLVDLWVEGGSSLGQEEKVLKMTNDGIKASQQFVSWGKQVNWKIEKGKAGIHDGARGHWVYDYRINNVDMFTDTIICGLQYGVIQGSGWYNIPDPENPSENLLRVQGRDNLIKALSQDANEKAAAGEKDSLMNLIRDECFKKNNISINYNWVTD